MDTNRKQGITTNGRPKTPGQAFDGEMESGYYMVSNIVHLFIKRGTRRGLCVGQANQSVSPGEDETVSGEVIGMTLVLNHLIVRAGVRV